MLQVLQRYSQLCHVNRTSTWNLPRSMWWDWACFLDDATALWSPKCMGFKWLHCGFIQVHHEVPPGSANNYYTNQPVIHKRAPFLSVAEWLDTVWVWLIESSEELTFLRAPCRKVTDNSPSDRPKKVHSAMCEINMVSEWAPVYQDRKHNDIQILEILAITSIWHHKSIKIKILTSQLMNHGLRPYLSNISFFFILSPNPTPPKHSECRIRTRFLIMSPNPPSSKSSLHMAKIQNRTCSST